MFCPKCGKPICRFENIDAEGITGWYLCCDTPAPIVDNWDVYEGLPPALQQVAIDKVLAEYAQIDKARAEWEVRFAARQKRWQETHGQQYILERETENGYQGQD